MVQAAMAAMAAMASRGLMDGLTGKQTGDMGGLVLCMLQIE